MKFCCHYRFHLYLVHLFVFNNIQFSLYFCIWIFSPRSNFVPSIFPPILFVHLVNRITLTPGCHISIQKISLEKHSLYCFPAHLYLIQDGIWHTIILASIGFYIVGIKQFFCDQNQPNQTWHELSLFFCYFVLWTLMSNTFLDVKGSVSV